MAGGRTTSVVPGKAGLASKVHDVYRGTIFNAVVLGLVSFTQPGIWNAMNYLGAGGEAQPYVVNAVNVITFAIMVFFSPLFSMLGNRYGMKWVIVFGTFGYVPYSAALYCNLAFGTQWFLIFGAVTCGFSAAALWPGEAAVAVGYPEVDRRGLCIAIWLALGKLGTIIGGAIELRLNIESKSTGSIAPSTYLVFVAIQCLGLPLSLLLAPAHKLVRRDGQTPSMASQGASVSVQARRFLAQFKRKEVLLLIPGFIALQWGSTYTGNFLAAYFTVRARTLSSLVVSLVGVVVDLGMGWVLDATRFRRKYVARGTWFFLLGLFSLVWIWNLVLQVRWGRSSPGEVDWSGPAWRESMAIYMLYRIAYEAIGVWLYWILGTYDVAADTIALSMGVLRSGESLGSALSYAVGSVESATLLTNLIVSVVVFYVAVPATTWAALLVPDRLPGEGEERHGSAGVEGSSEDGENGEGGVGTDRIATVEVGVQGKS